MANAAVILKKGEGRTLKAGGLWVYDNEIDRVEGGFENGDTVENFPPFSTLEDFEDSTDSDGY